MIEIRKHPEVTAALYISDLSIKLPQDHDWVIISNRFSAEEIASSQNIAEAFQAGLIELRVTGDYSDVPEWYLATYAPVVRIPTELLQDNGLTVISKLQNLKEAAHPIMWAIVRSGLLYEESNGQNRPDVFDVLVS